MSKSVLHYKRRMQSLVGPHGVVVRAWRSPDRDPRYAVDCNACSRHRLVRVVKGDYQRVLRAWVVHSELLHPGVSHADLPSVEITDEDRQRAEFFRYEVACIDQFLLA